MTATPSSEFSPLLTPDHQHFSVVKQIHSGPVDQQVVTYPLDLQTSGQEILPRVKNVGYHCWLDAEQLALYLDEDPTKLALVSISDGLPQIYSSGIGRCLRRNASGDLIYVHKYSDTFWFLKSLDPRMRTSDILVETLSGREDFALGNDGTIFMGSGSKLYVFNPDTPDKWIPVFDLSVFGLQNITRLAISADNQIAIVDQE